VDGGGEHAEHFAAGAADGGGADEEPVRAVDDEFDDALTSGAVE